MGASQGRLDAQTRPVVTLFYASYGSSLLWQEFAQAADAGGGAALYQLCDVARDPERARAAGVTSVPVIVCVDPLRGDKVALQGDTAMSDLAAWMDLRPIVVTHSQQNTHFYAASTRATPPPEAPRPA
jgi:hypothetical protein